MDHSDTVVFVMPDLDENGDPIPDEGVDNMFPLVSSGIDKLPPKSSSKKSRSNAESMSSSPTGGKYFERMMGSNTNPRSSSSVVLPPHLAERLRSPIPSHRLNKEHERSQTAPERLRTCLDGPDPGVTLQSSVDEVHYAVLAPESESIEETPTVELLERVTQTPREWSYIRDLPPPPPPAPPIVPPTMHRLTEISTHGLTSLLEDLIRQHEERARLHKVRADGLDHALARRNQTIARLTEENARLDKSLSDAQTLVERLQTEKHSLKFRLDVLEEKNRGLLQQHKDLTNERAET
ncbi:hypothetical protein OIV83_001058 [Microbotryomycetes sp. JL201]|nr:hypothetical protein OIV83_001058 [Microbotryomycetes sp. JL201]